MTALLRHRQAGEAATPTWWASWAVRSPSLPVPSEHRYRYRQEFLAELYGMTPTQQLHHATGVLSRVWTLRVALNEPARLMPKYRECLGCGTQRVISRGPGVPPAY